MPDSNMPPFQRTTAFRPSVRQPPAREWLACLGQLWGTAQQGLGLGPAQAGTHTWAAGQGSTQSRALREGRWGRGKTEAGREGLQGSRLYRAVTI